MSLIELAAAASAAITFLAVFCLWRLQTILNPRRPKVKRDGRKHRDEQTQLLIVLGSGGHTAEIISMLERATTVQDPASRLDWQTFTHRTWIVSSGDSISADRARQFEAKMGQLVEADSTSATYDLQIVPRAREIHQPLYTAPISSIRCLLTCLIVLTQHTTAHSKVKKDFPDLILCNGPATATIVIFTSILLRFFDFRGCNSRGKMRTLYVESWARVKKLSLSGMLLSRVADRFLVQWPELEKSAGTRAEFAGVLV